MSRPIAIVLCGRTEPSVRADYGDFDDWFKAALPGPTSVFEADLGATLPDPAELAGVVLSGSPAMVTERHTWSLLLEAWCRSADGRVPILGVCYGHQLLAQAFGGEVADNPRGTETGSCLLKLSPVARDDLLVGGLPDPLWVFQSHTQSVVRAPPRSIVLAHNTHDPHQALRHSPTTWGVQFHPEFDAPILRGYLKTRAERQGRTPKELAALVDGLQESNESRAVLSRFGAVCRARE